jgi:hypothetical protein
MPALVPARGPIRPVQFQQPMAGGQPGPKTPEASFYLGISELPGKEKLFRLDSEAALNERIRQDYRSRALTTGPGSGDQRVYFPEDPVLTRDLLVPRHWEPKYTWAEPNYLCYRRLYFEQPNAERWGWDFGAIQPFVCAGWFFADVIVLPYHAGTDPCRCYECSAGRCLPGDPVPYRLFPPGLSATGFLSEAAVVAALFAIFP